MASTTLSLADPPTTSVIGAAVEWIESVTLGTTGTTIAVLAVATVGLMMLSGRVPLRRGVTVVAGCFILFGSSVIAAGIRSARFGSDVRAAAVPTPAATVSPLENVTASSDPYAGASVPPR